MSKAFELQSSQWLDVETCVELYDGSRKKASTANPVERVHSEDSAQGTGMRHSGSSGTNSPEDDKMRKTSPRSDVLIQ